MRVLADLTSSGSGRVSPRTRGTAGGGGFCGAASAGGAAFGGSLGATAGGPASSFACVTSSAVPVFRPAFQAQTPPARSATVATPPATNQPVAGRDDFGGRRGARSS